jgi:hypothetical protein
MTVNQHMVLGSELSGSLNTVNALLDGGEFKGVIPKKSAQRLRKIRTYLNAILSDMGGIASRQYPDLDAKILNSLYSSAGATAGSETKEGRG